MAWWGCGTLCRSLKGIGHAGEIFEHAASLDSLLAGTLALVMIWGSASAWAQNADDEELPADTKFFRKLFKEFGLQREGEGVEFRERAPLVVPPSRELPPPQSADAVARNPAWPKDPDVRRRNEAVSRRRKGQAPRCGGGHGGRRPGIAAQRTQCRHRTCQHRQRAKSGRIGSPDDAVAAWQQGLSRLLHEQVVRARKPRNSPTSPREQA